MSRGAAIITSRSGNYDPVPDAIADVLASKVENAS